jgi:hypothetical protein
MGYRTECDFAEECQYFVEGTCPSENHIVDCSTCPTYVEMYQEVDTIVEDD